MSLKKVFVVLLITAGITLVGNFVGPKVSPIEALPGMIILICIAFIGILLSKIIRIRIPAVAYIVTIATIMTIPGFPFADKIYEFTSKVDFLALCTPILAYAGIYTGKNLGTLKKTGWRIFVLAIFVMIGTYVGSAIIAQIILKAIGQI
ncbi:DUF340 domain-containing protein [Peptoniphilus sp.]|uniref:DUF340 domain-containing protein n=1 Tax=Peptoniphilus sp. TaxID=1971214 RepID=UPI002A831AE0|nr:DUF340 domain-containing protein [Peptoniphilus sp.]MDY3903552.1 DUF340 domain-containing protein [Peptoniphilus sp.]